MFGSLSFAQQWPERSLTAVKTCTQKPYFYIFVENFLSLGLCNYRSSVYLQEIFQTSARKPRNQCKHQQLCVNFVSRGHFLLRRRRALSIRIG